MINHQAIDIYAFIDFREYLKAIYEKTKEVKPHFSFRYFSRMAGMGGQSYLRMVMRGERNLSLTSISKFKRALKLSAKEGDYFETLVLYNQAKTQDQKDRYYYELNALRPKIKIVGLEKDKYEYVTHSFYVTLREMSALPGFQDDPEWILAHLRHHVTLRDVKTGLKVLERLGLLVRGDDGRLKHSGTTLQSPVSAESVEILNYHRQVLTEGKDIIMTAPYEEWDAASMTIPVSKKVLPVIMSFLHQCREQIADIVNKDESPLHEVVQINMQMFPVTKASQQS